MKVNVLPVPVYHNPLGDCSNNGISNRFKRLLVACPNGPLSFDADVELPLNFCMVDYIHNVAFLVPAMITEDGMLCHRPGWYMYGGNIADTSDSRWHDVTGSYYPLKIHDRKEW